MRPAYLAVLGAAITVDCSSNPAEHLTGSRRYGRNLVKTRVAVTTVDIAGMEQPHFDRT
jgi:hypothetical protein